MAVAAATTTATAYHSSSTIPQHQDIHEQISIASEKTATETQDYRITLHGAAEEDVEHHQEEQIETAAHTPVTEKGQWNEPSSNEDQQDGGYGWFVVIGAFLAQFTGFGITSSWGILQDYLERHIFKDVPDAQLQLSFAGTIIELLIHFMGPLFQILTARYGIKVVLIIATIFSTLGLELASLTKEIWQLYLSQGVMFGIGASFMYVAALGVPPQWFNRRRGLGLGIVASGSGVGGLVLPFVITRLNSSLDVGWTYRVLGFIVFTTNVIACILIKERFPRHKKGKKPLPLREVFNFTVLKDTNYILWVIGSGIAFMGFFIPFFFLPAYITYSGMSASDSSAIIAVLSAANFIGRIIIGYVGDRIGRLNADILFKILCGISSLTIWIYARTYASIMGYAVTFGFLCSSYIALMSPITATILGMERFPTGLTVLLLTNMVSVIGPNIASAVETSLNAEPYLVYKVFAGVTYLLGGLILAVLKIKMTKSLFARI